MARRQGSARQLTFEYFGVPRHPSRTPGGLQFSLELRNLLSCAVKESALSRAEIAAAMTDRLFGDAGDGEVTKAQLDSWTAPSRDAWRFPLEYLPAFLEATGAIWLLDKVAEKCGCRVLVGEQALLAELGAIALHKKRLSEREVELKRTVPADVLRRLARKIADR